MIGPPTTQWGVVAEPRGSAVKVKFPEIWVELARPFHPDEVKQLSKGGAKLDYVTARTVMNRLDAVLGPENWEDSFVEAKDGFCCTITITLPDGSRVSKSDGGGFADMKDEDDSEKSGYSSAFKRAAVKFGIARYLYKNGLPDWIDAALRGKPLPKPERPLREFVEAAAKFAGVTLADFERSILEGIAETGVAVSGNPAVDFPQHDGPPFRAMVTRLAKKIKEENAAETASGVK